jgi:hypothetical protein
MKKLYFYHSALDYFLSSDGYGHGFVFYDITPATNRDKSIIPLVYLNLENIFNNQTQVKL